MLLQFISLTVAYDGTRYLGWQKTECGPSIQQKLENSLSTILQESISVEAASRTDAGVHARGQVVSFSTTQTLPSKERFKYSLNSLLPKDIVVVDLKEEAEGFHPTLDNNGKEYHYSICTDRVQLPIHRDFSWHFYHVLNREKMQRAAKYLIGEHDFMAFCTEKNEHPYDNYIREIDSIDLIEQDNERWLIKVAGKSFLYKMVRTLVGTLAYVGCGKIDADSIPAILTSGRRADAGITAPAHGLCLAKVFF